MLIECPRCGEADERSIGKNRCGLCECEFFVGGPKSGKDYVPAEYRRQEVEPKAQ